MEQHLPFLRSLPLFRGIAEPEILCLLRSLDASELRFAKREILWEPIRRVPYLCVVVEGCFQIAQEDWQGNRSIIDSFAPGNFIGESPGSMEGLQPFYFMVKAGTTAIVFSSAADLLDPPEEMRGAHKVFLRNLLDTLVRKEMRLLYKIECLSCRTTREKLMRYLNIQAAEQGSRTVTMDFTRQELADYLCVDRSAMCTELTRMQRDGLIRCEKRAFELLGD